VTDRTELDALIAPAADALLGLGATEVYVFGSLARGDHTSTSDVDLAVRGLPPQRFFRAMADAATALRRDVDLVDLDDDRAFADHLLRKGELLRVR